MFQSAASVLLKASARSGPSARRRVASNTVLSIACFLLFCVRPLSAQGLDEYDALRLPSGPAMMCYPVTIGPADSAAAVLHLIDGDPAASPRDVMVAYDSLGNPLYLTVRARWKVDAGGALLHAVAARLAPTEHGFLVVAPSAAAGAGGDEPPNQTEPVPTSLSPSDLARARTLADRLWSFPCRNLKRPPGPP